MIFQQRHRPFRSLKETRQGEGESILAYNQRYKALVERVEGRPIELITSPVAMEMYLGTIIPPLRKSIKNSIFWNSKHAPNTVGEAMSKAQQLHVKHLYSTGNGQEEDQPKPVEDVVINEISKKFENKYRGRREDFRDSSRNRPEAYGNEQGKWQTYENRRNFNYPQRFDSRQLTAETKDQGSQRHSDSSTSRHEAVSEQEPNQRQNRERQVEPREGVDDSTRRQNRQDNTNNQGSVLRGGYTQILVNPHATNRSPSSPTGWRS